MGERGKVWRKVWAEAKDLGKKLIFPTLAGVAAAITPLEDKLKAEEKDSRPVVYLPEAKIDSALAWQYGKVQEMNDFILKNFTWPVRLDLGDGWYATITNGMDFGYKDRGIVGGFSIEPEDLEKDLRDKKVRIIKYTDEYGNNLLYVQMSPKHANIFFPGSSDYGIIMLDDNSPFTIGRIGVAKVEDEIYGKGVAVIVEIIGDGIIGIAVFPDKQLITDETRIVAIR